MAFRPGVGKKKYGEKRDREGNSRDRDERGTGLRRTHRKKVCIFCVEKKRADYKDVEFMRRFTNDRGRILPRNHSGCCAQHQRMVATAVKRTRHIGLLPFVID